MIELLTKHPKAAKLVREHFLEKLLEGLKTEGLPEDFKEHVREQGITDEKVSKLIDNNSRALFDIFDENGIYITITHTDGKIWYWGIRQPELKKGEETRLYDGNRKIAEKAAVEKAFEALEIKLT